MQSRPRPYRYPIIGLSCLFGCLLRLHRCGSIILVCKKIMWKEKCWKMLSLLTFLRLFVKDLIVLGIAHFASEHLLLGDVLFTFYFHFHPFRNVWDGILNEGLNGPKSGDKIACQAFEWCQRIRLHDNVFENEHECQPSGQYMPPCERSFVLLWMTARVIVTAVNAPFNKGIIEKRLVSKLTHLKSSATTDIPPTWA